MAVILYITNGISGAGGLERVLSVKTAALIDALGYDVHILTLNDAAVPFYEFHPKITFHNIVAGGDPIRFIRQYAAGIKAIAEKVCPTVISVCDDGLKGFFIPTLLRQRFPIIYERHASVNLNFNRGSSARSMKSKVTHSLMQVLAKTFDRFVVLTCGNLSEWRSDNLTVIPNPLSFFPLGASALTSKRIIAVGSHSYNKGYDLLLEAWTIVSAAYPEWSLDIYGRKDADLTYVKLARTMQLSNVAFHDPVADIESQYLQSSIMVLPSRSEGFGMVLIEAMACGVPCVSFDCPCGPADIITNNEDGFLVPNGNVSEFAEKIMVLIGDRQLRMQMGDQARRNVGRFRSENIVSQWDQLFKAVQR